MTKFNPYKIALNLLDKELKSMEISPVSKVSDSKKISLPGEGFNVDKLKNFLCDYQKKGFKKQRTIDQFSAYEIFQCLRKSYYLRQGVEPDPGSIIQYPFATIKASMGNVVEKFLLSIYNEIPNGTKFRNDVDLIWDTRKALGTKISRFSGKIDGLAYDDSVILDAKFTNDESQSHLDQLFIYGMILEELRGKECVQAIEVLYLNSDMNSVTIKRFNIDREAREKEFLYFKRRIKLYDDMLTNKHIPPAESHKCSFCPYKITCENAGSSTANDLSNKDNIQIPNNKNKLNSDSLKGTKMNLSKHVQSDTEIKILI